MKKARTVTLKASFIINPKFFIMKTRFLSALFLLFILMACPCISQTIYSIPSADFIQFHKNISDAERMLKHDSSLQAYAKFDIAFQNYKGQVNPSHYMDAAIAALNIKEEFKALHFYEKALIKGYEPDSLTKEKMVFFSQNTKKEFNDNVLSWEEKGREAKNSSYENSVYAMQENTKKYNSPAYKTAIEYCTNCMKNKACNKKSPEFTSKYRLMKDKMKADSVNAIELLGYINQYGFPDYKFMDGKACEIARDVLLNYDSDKNNSQLNSILFQALLNGYISPSFYAQVIDKRNIFNGLAPEFYEPTVGYEKTIKNVQAIANKNREKIGLHAVQILNPLELKKVDIKNTKAVEKLYTKIYTY